MPIPYGLLGQTDIEKKKRGPFKPGEGYWLGSQYVFPEIPAALPPGMNPSPAMPPAGGLSPAQQPQGGILGPGMDMGDSGAGNGLGGGSPGATAPGQAPSFSEAGHVNAPDPTANPVGLPSLPSFQEQAPAPTAPAPGLAPAPSLQDLAVSEVDPQGPSGAGKGKSNTGAPGSATAPAAEAAAVAAGLGRANVDKTIQEKGFIEGIKGLMEQSRGLLGASIGAAVSEGISPSDTATGAPGGFAPGHDKESKDYGGGTDTNGGPGSSGASGTSGTGPNAGDEGGLGAWRKGGPVPDDGDEMLEPVRGILHEREFVLRPEAAQYYGKGILGALNAKAIPKAKLSGLLRL